MGRLRISILWTDDNGPVGIENAVDTDTPWAYREAVSHLFLEVMELRNNRAIEAEDVRRAVTAQQEVGS